MRPTGIDKDTCVDYEMVNQPSLTSPRMDTIIGIFIIDNSLLNGN